MDWFIGAVVIIILVLVAVRYLIFAAGRQMEDSAAFIQENVENFKLPKIKLMDLAGYAGYQIFEMSKPGIQATIEGWVKERQQAQKVFYGETEQKG